jgi:hypothetical protein
VQEILDEHIAKKLVWKKKLWQNSIQNGGK